MLYRHNKCKSMHLRYNYNHSHSSIHKTQFISNNTQTPLRLVHTTCTNIKNHRIHHQPLHECARFTSFSWDTINKPATSAAVKKHQHQQPLTTTTNTFTSHSTNHLHTTKTHSPSKSKHNIQITTQTKQINQHTTQTTTKNLKLHVHQLHK